MVGSVGKLVEISGGNCLLILHCMFVQVSQFFIWPRDGVCSKDDKTMSPCLITEHLKVICRLFICINLISCTTLKLITNILCETTATFFAITKEDILYLINNQDAKIN